LKKGELLFSGDVDEIGQKLRGDRTFSITLRDRIEDAEKTLLEVQGVTQVSREDETLQVSVKDEIPDAGELIRILVEQGFAIIACHEESTDLEDIFMRVTKGLVA